MTDQEITEFLAARVGPILDEVIRLRREVASLSTASVLAEREACAKVASDGAMALARIPPTTKRDAIENDMAISTANRIAAAIRARGGE